MVIVERRVKGVRESPVGCDLQWRAHFLFVSTADDTMIKPVICNVPKDFAFLLCPMKVKVGGINSYFSFQLIQWQTEQTWNFVIILEGDKGYL